MNSWADMLNDQLEAFEEIIFCTLSDEQMKVEFDDGYGIEKGVPFTAWSEDRVFFPICYDGSEWVGSAPRCPCGESLEHQGGG